MLHEPRQRHVVRRGELAHRRVALPAERIEDAAARAVGERGEQRVELVVGILNHKV
jgi:HD superfamily phosphodiesterase